ncbi:hypothetical protein SAMN05444166_6531 [Singulisphaera sp. GP187]|nr:hypothetical protein SAMN05444166_6531 [Singulisphaera sp. GP187]
MMPRPIVSKKGKTGSAKLYGGHEFRAWNPCV